VKLAAFLLHITLDIPWVFPECMHARCLPACFSKGAFVTGKLDN